MILAAFLSSCTSQPQLPTAANPFRPIKDFPNASIIGTIQTKIETVVPNNVSMVNEAAYIALLEVAKKEYTGSIDVFDISWVFDGTFNRRAGYTVNGKVASLGNSRNTAVGVEGALERAAEQVLSNVPIRSRIAIVYITARDRSTTEYIAGEPEYIWVNEGYILSDRAQLENIRREQNFQMSGEVDDRTAVDIGKFLGADIIVTGTVDGQDNLRRLRLRALSTQTAQVVGAASERF